MTIRLRGERVLLRAFRESEYPLVWEEEVASSGGAPTDEDAERRERLTAQLRASGGWTPQELRLAIEAEGALVGDVQARRWGASLPSGVTELGINLFGAARRRGFGTDALVTLDRYLFDEEGFHRVQLSTDLDNVAMRRAAEKAGFTYEGILRGFWSEGGQVHDYAMYGRTLGDHRATRT